MAKERVKPLMMSSFTSKGEVFAAILSNGVLKQPLFMLQVWNTSDGNLLAEWKHPDGESDVQFSCIACSFVGKKRRKENGTCLVALGTDDGEVFVINATAAERKWKSSGHHQGYDNIDIKIRIAALSFANKGRKICVISTDGTTCEMDSETGELLKETKISKKYISSSVYIYGECSEHLDVVFYDDKILAAANTKIRVLGLEDGEELLKFSTDTGPVKHISTLEGTNVIITSGFDDKNLQVWKNEANTETVTSGPILSMRHPPLAIECKNGCNGDDLIVLSVSESGVAYIWNLKNSSEENIVPAKIKVEASKSNTDPNVSGKKKRHTSILAARLSSVDGDEGVTAVIVYGSINSPHFTSVDVAGPGEDIVIDATTDVQENGVTDGKGIQRVELNAGFFTDQKEVRGKKRTASDADSANTVLKSDNDHGDPMDGVQIDNDMNEPTMGEKLASLNITNNESGNDEKAESTLAKPPSADSVHVLLKQALHADDRSLLLDCLFRQDEKVIRNSVYLLNPSDVFKLLESLISMIQARGAVVSCALPWLRSLLLQHASIIMSQEASLIALNSLYQLIESRISTFNPTLQLSSCLDLLYSKTLDDGVDEEGPPEPIIFEDFSDEDDEGSEEDGDDMETDEEDNEELEALSKAQQWRPKIRSSEPAKPKARRRRNQPNVRNGEGQGAARERQDRRHAGSAWERTKETADQAGQATKEKAGAARDKAAQMGQATKEKASDMAQSTKETAVAGKEKTGGVMQRTSEQVKSMAQGAADAVKHTLGMGEAGAGHEEEAGTGFGSGTGGGVNTTTTTTRKTNY
ncbi:hypothetical protein OSB04_004676 [Centaurea solstitialis]|uniref:Small-subunit processome Utp12 domain-containing protein n=1 Tax=Centaurea solstitialis TaxID=347529 RepID=A0AA38TSF8_9ASTR|nr:hypothetical protein OSB04_004676 [Centaurea solstitialis]